MSLFLTASRRIARRVVPTMAPLPKTQYALQYPKKTPPCLWIPSRCFSKERAGKGIRPGVAILVDDAPHRVSKIIQGKRGKGGGFVRATVKNLISGQVFEKTYTSDEMVEFADLEKETATYSWDDADNYIFMSRLLFQSILLATVIPTP